jgi:hypothetical protein
MASSKEDLISAIDAALSGDWERAHEVAQRHEGHPAADWLHAVLHKIEGDDGNSRYWYARVAHTFDEYADPKNELAAIRATISR